MFLLLTLATTLFSKNLEKKTATFVQQTSTFRRQKLDPFYLTFIAELNEFILRVQKQQEQT